MKSSPPRFLLRAALVLGLTSLAATDALARSTTPATNRTGAPGHTTCASCHSSSGNGNVSLTFSGGDKYEPGQLYSVEVTITDPTQTRFGFQMVSRSGPNKDILNAGTWSAGDPETQVYGAGEKHVAHKNVPFGMSSPYTFTVNWQAPPAGTGDVTFYVAANAANGNGFSGAGDHTYTSNLTISELTAPAPPPTLTGLTILPDKTAQMVLGGTPGLIYHIEFLDKNNQWTFLQEIGLQTESQLVTDGSAPNAPNRIYRAREQDP